uniref:Protein kinase domain-containing protein n=1 Tax=Macrostomum lignano TaxID=282301 RepID=A0A1I8F5I0_9PLAT
MPRLKTMVMQGTAAEFTYRMCSRPMLSSTMGSRLKNCHQIPTISHQRAQHLLSATGLLRQSLRRAAAPGFSALFEAAAPAAERAQPGAVSATTGQPGEPRCPARSRSGALLGIGRPSRCRPGPPPAQHQPDLQAGLAQHGDRHNAAGDAADGRQAPAPTERRGHRQQPVDGQQAVGVRFQANGDVAQAGEELRQRVAPGQVGFSSSDGQPARRGRRRSGKAAADGDGGDDEGVAEDGEQGQAGVHDEEVHPAGLARLVQLGEVSALRTRQQQAGRIRVARLIGGCHRNVSDHRQMERKLSQKRGKCHQQFDIFEHSFNREGHDNQNCDGHQGELAGAALQASPWLRSDAAGEKRIRWQRQLMTRAFDLSSGRTQRGNHGDRLLLHRPAGVRGRQHQPGVFQAHGVRASDGVAVYCWLWSRAGWRPGASGSAWATRKAADLPAPVVSDFCIPFDRDLLKKLRANRAALQSIADRTCSLLYIRKTLLLRGTYRTQNLGPSTSVPLLPPAGAVRRGLSALGTAASTSATASPCLLNRSVPENTSLRVSRQRLRKSDDYFGKMPLLPDRTWPAWRPADPVLREQQLAAGPAGRWEP